MVFENIYHGISCVCVFATYYINNIFVWGYYGIETCRLAYPGRHSHSLSLCRLTGTNKIIRLYSSDLSNIIHIHIYLIYKIFNVIIMNACVKDEESHAEGERDNGRAR